MAISAANAGRMGKQPSAPTFVDFVDVTCDNVYPGGGWDLDLTDYLPHGATVMEVHAPPHVATGYVPVYDRTNSKLVILESGGATNPLVDLTTAAAMDGEVVRLTVLSY